jgi:lipoprotein signal peptidase
MNKYYPYILGIFGLDLVTKLLAYFILPLNEYVSVFGHNLEFYLTFNTGASGTKAASITQSFNNPNMALFVGGVFGLVAGTILYLTKNVKFKLWQKSVIVLLALTLYVGLQMNISNIRTYVFDDYFISWFTKIGAMTLVFGLFIISKDKWLKVILISYFSCGLGNLISHFYPPFAVIDFISAPLLYDFLRLGICNLADILADICLILLVIRLLIIWFKTLYFKMTNNTKPIET